MQSCLEVLRHRPLLLWTTAFSAGIGLTPGMAALGMAALGRLTPAAALCLAALCLVAFGAAALLLRHWPLLLPAGLLLLGLGAGAMRLASFQTLAPADVSRWADTPRPITLTGMVASDPEARPGGRMTFFVQAELVRARGQTAQSTGEAAVTLEPEAVRGLVLDYGDRVTLEGQAETPPDATNPGAFSWRDYLARRAVYCEMHVKRPGAAILAGAGASNPFLRLAWRVRQKAVSALQSCLPPTAAAVLSGILIGRRTDLSTALTADFVHTGTVHILASAGLHVGIVALWLERLFRKLTLPRKAQALLLIASLLLYALVCGGRPAVVRAALMASLYFGSVLFEREPDGPTAISAAALIILLLQPTALFEPGFQLSFLTIFTLALTMPAWSGFWHPKVAASIGQPALCRAAEWAIDGLGLSLLAQLGAAPVVALSYSEVSLSSAPANALVVPLLFVLIPLGLLGILAWTFWHSFGAALLAAAGWGITLILGTVRGLGDLPGSYFALPPPPLPLVLMFYALVYGGTDAVQRFLGRRPVAPPPAPLGPAAAGAAGLVGTVSPP